MGSSNSRHARANLGSAPEHPGLPASNTDSTAVSAGSISDASDDEMDSPPTSGHGEMEISTIAGTLGMDVATFDEHLMGVGFPSISSTRTVNAGWSRSPG